MFLYLSKVISLLLYPLGLSLIFLVVRERLPSWRWLGWAALAILLFFSTPIVSQGLLASLEGQYPPVNPKSAPKARLIVILGGYLHSPSSQRPLSEFTDAGDRLLMGLRLYRANRAPQILLTGGNIEFLGRGVLPEAQAAKTLLIEWGVPEQAILIEDRSQNTHENAQFTQQLMTKRGIRGPILLVTSGYHLPRSVAIFTKAGFQLSPIPTDYQTGWGEPDLLFQWLPRADALADATLALKEWLGWGIYRLRGWA